MGRPWTCTQKVEEEKSNSYHVSSGDQVLRTKWALLIVHGLLLKASWRSTSWPKVNTKILRSTLWTWIGDDGFQAFSTISLTTTLMKFLVKSILPTSERLQTLVGMVGVVREMRLSAQLNNFILAMSSSIDWDGQGCWSWVTLGPGYYMNRRAKYVSNQAVKNSNAIWCNES